MTDTLLALIPTYGIWLILASVMLSCLALPIPSSIMLMVAGGFSAAGDFAFWQLVMGAHTGFILGDQIAFWLARHAGRPLITRFESRPKSAAITGRAKRLIEKRGLVAVFLSRTFLSPLGPYVGYVSGALEMHWLRFTSVAAIGAFLWSMTYAWLGYTFADQITQIAALISSSVGIVLAGGVFLVGITLLIRNYRQASAVAQKAL